MKTLEKYTQQLPDHWLSTLLPAEQALLNRSLEKTELGKKISEKSSKIINEMVDYLRFLGENTGHVV